GPGNALIEMGATLDAGDQIYGLGGPGTLTVSLDGDYSAGLALTMLSEVTGIDLASGNSYNLTEADVNVGAGQTLTVDGSALGASDNLTFDGSAETDGNLVLIGGAGADVLTGGAQSDTFQFDQVSDSTGTGYDTITNIDFSSDLISLDAGAAAPVAIDAAITSGALSTASFDSDLAAAVDAGHLAAGDAVLFTADSGTLSGHTFLVVDHNGQAGYQAGQDYVIDVTGYAGTLTTASFWEAVSSAS
ncbi:MAG TPA: bluetail domain-containing putative surface protein, partial [Rhizomicrobium sp.]|nr:bluetail domain-containing putative surface protein [Rhizomicrobium sp.]